MMKLEKVEAPQCHLRSPDTKACNDDSSKHLALKQFDWGHPNEIQTEWLTSQGVGFHALLCPWPVGATRAAFDGDRFNQDPKGKSALTFVCFDRGEPIDICAWSPKTGEAATFVGRAVFLGDEDDLFNSATWFDGGDLLIHASPLEWLKADRDGAVILNEKRAAPYLTQCQSAFCADPSLAARVRKIVRPKPTLKVFTAAREVAHA